MATSFRCRVGQSLAFSGFGSGRTPRELRSKTKCFDGLLPTKHDAARRNIRTFATVPFPSAGPKGCPPPCGQVSIVGQHMRVVSIDREKIVDFTIRVKRTFGSRPAKNGVASVDCNSFHGNRLRHGMSATVVRNRVPAKQKKEKIRKRILAVPSRKGKLGGWDEIRFPS